MKSFKNLFKTYFAILFSVLILKMNAQVIVKDFDFALGTNQSELLWSISKTNDGGYIIGGSTSAGINGDKSEISNGSSDYWIIKTDDLGNKVWDKSFGGNDIDALRKVIQTNDGGYLLGGSSKSGISGDKTQNNRGLNDFWIVKTDANGNKLWDKTYGGNSEDDFFYLEQIADGGFIIGGTSRSGSNGDKSQPSRGLQDFWVIRTDMNGNKVWDKTLGGNDTEDLRQVKEVSGSGFLIGGSSFSDISGDKSTPRRGFSQDYWLVKVDDNGIKLWDKTYGGTNLDLLKSFQETADGGIIIGGYSKSGDNNDKSEPSRGQGDFWLVKTDGSGNIIWDKTFGGVNDEGGSDPGGNISVLQTNDMGFIIGGSSKSGISGEKTNNSNGNWDYWMVKTDASGNYQFDKSFGGNTVDECYQIIEDSPGEYLLGGWSLSGVSGDKTIPSKGGFDFWVVKMTNICGTPSNTCSQISGTLYLDENESCTLDPGEIAFNNKKILVEAVNSTQTIKTFTKPNGEYELQLLPRTYDIRLSSQDDVKESTTCGPSGLVYNQNIAPSSSLSGFNFYIRPQCNTTLNNAVTSVAPKNNENHVDPNSTIDVTLNCLVDQATLDDQSSFIVYGKQSGRYDGTFVINNSPAAIDKSEIIFTPDNPLKHGEEISVIITSQLFGPGAQSTSPYIFKFNVANVVSAGEFNVPIHFTSGIKPVAVAVADINNDGFTDIVATNEIDNSFSLLINDAGSPGNFLPKIDFTTLSEPQFIEARDLNNDDHTDIVVAYKNKNVSVFLNDGLGGFPTKTDYLASPQKINSLDVQDVNGDGFADLVTANVFNEEARVLINDGTGQFLTTPFKYAGHGIMSAAFEDFDRDGDMDIVNTTFLGAITILENDNQGAFENVNRLCNGRNPQGNGVWQDFNNDHYLDLAVGYNRTDQNYVSIYQNNSIKLEIPAKEYLTGNQPKHLVSGDIDGDGDMDIINSHSTDNNGNTITVLKNNGSGSFSEVYRLKSFGNNPQGMALADVDNDGTADLIVANKGADVVSVYRNLVNPHILQGTVNLDINGNGILETNEPGLSGWEVEIQPNNAIVETDDQGVFTFLLSEPGTYQVEALSKPGFSRTVPLAPTYFTETLTASGSGYSHTINNSHINFGSLIDSCGGCLEINITPKAPWPAPLVCDSNSADTVCIEVINNCGVPLADITVNALIFWGIDYCYTFPTNLQYLQPGTGNTSSSWLDSLSFGLGTYNIVLKLDTPNVLLPGYTNRMEACLTTTFTGHSTCNEGDTICYEGSVTGKLFPSAIDTTFLPCANYDSLCHIVAWSFDPNYKEVIPKGCGPEGFIFKEDTLHNTIHFQNTGSAPASQVVIIDSLNSNYDLGSLQITSNSHPMTYQVLPGNVIEFKFGTPSNPINLPDSASDINGSKGFVSYTILPKSSLSPGDQLISYAEIYFDANDPIRTNQVLNTISEFPLPQAAIISGLNALCPGEPTTLIASEGVAYQWSTGAFTRSIIVNQPGEYEVIIYYENACSSSITTEISQGSLNPKISPNGVIEICTGESISLDAGDYESYLWSNGATTQTINVNSTGNYYVTVTDLSGCTGTSDTVVVEALPQPFVHAGLCKTVYPGYEPEACVILTAFPSGGTPPYDLIWNTGESTTNIEACPTNTSTYSVTVTDANGCSYTGGVQVRAIDVSCGNKNDKVEICHSNGNSSQTLCVDKNSVATHLNNHGDILGACGILNPCLTSKQQKNQVVLNQENTVNVYPNPFKDQTLFEWHFEESTYCELIIFDAQGKRIEVLFKGITEQNKTQQVSWNGAGQAPGMYFYTLTTAYQKFQGKLTLIK